MIMPNAQQNGDFAYDSAEAFVFLAPLRSRLSARLYNTVYAVYALRRSPKFLLRKNFFYAENVIRHWSSK